MKKLIVVIMALITLFSASVTVYGSSVEWQVLGEIYNAEFNSRACLLCEASSSHPYLSPNMVDANGTLATQKTTYNLLYSLYEHLTLNGVSLTSNVVTPSVVQWYEYGGYCWILVHVDEDATINAGKTGVVSNYAAKMLYCDAPVEETTYAVSAIAGVGSYYLTNRPIGTAGDGYLGDLELSYDNWSNVRTMLSDLSSSATYYSFVYSVNGELRYYIATLIGGTKHFVCNREGQLFYSVKRDAEDVSGSTGGTFDASEVIAAINSVYNKLDSGFRVVTKGINETNNRITSLNDDFIIHMNNTVSGLSAANGTLNTIADYLSGLMNKQIIERTITYSGTDVFIDWDSNRTPVGVDVNGVENNIYVKTSYGTPKSASGYIYDFGDSYNLVQDADGYPMLVFAGEYPDHGPNPPDSTILYYPFDDSTVNPVVGESTITVTGTEQYAEGVHGQAYVFSENTSALTGVYSTSTQLFNAENGAYTISTWLYPTGSPTSGYFQFRIGGARYMTIRMGTTGQLDVNYYITTSSATTVSTGRSLTTNEWNHIAVCYDGETLYIFLNGELCHMAKTTVICPTGDDFKIFSSSSGKVPIGTMVDEFVIVDGAALWTSSFDPYNEAVFSMIKDDYYLSEPFPRSYSYSRDMTPEERLAYEQRVAEQYPDGVPDDFEYNYRLYGFESWASADLCYSLAGAGGTTDTDSSTVPTSMGRLGDDVSYIFYDRAVGEWRLYDCVSKEIFGVNNFPVDCDTFFLNDTYTIHSPFEFTVATFNDYVVGSPVWLDIPDGGTITVTYLEYVNWFDSIYSLIDMQSDQLTAIVQKMGNATGDTIINIENTVVDITQDSDAYNIFYVEKTDGTTESVGDAAKDAAVFVGDVLSMFYRLVFDDALDNVGILKDFEGAYSNTEVSVW